MINFRLTNKQKKELDILMENRPDNVDWADQTEEDIKMFFEWSDKGMHRDIASIHTTLKEGRTGFHALVWAKKWRERSAAGL
jgi:hypothetical protein